MGLETNQMLDLTHYIEQDLILLFAFLLILLIIYLFFGHYFVLQQV